MYHHRYDYVRSSELIDFGGADEDRTRDLLTASKVVTNNLKNYKIRESSAKLILFLVLAIIHVLIRLMVLGLFQGDCATPVLPRKSSCDCLMLSQGVTVYTKRSLPCRAKI